MTVVDKIKKFVETECKKPQSKYGQEPFLFHFVPTAKFAGQLADELGGDKEVCLIAAWLHDIGAIVGGRQDHHISGARIAEKKLKELNYPANKIEAVKNCILNHRGSVKNKTRSLEEQIVVEADTMSNFDNISGIFKAAFIFEGLDQGEAKISVRKKLQNKWKQLHFKDSKKLLKEKYEAAMLLLK
jgi:uncharacterized protein